MPALHLTHFSSRVHASADRNLTGLPELDAWLERLAEERLGEADSRSERQAKAAHWLATVARKGMIRAGSAVELSARETQALAEEHAWARKAVSEGRALQRLRLDADERDALAEALDWLRADAGPSLSGDWSRISLAQAKKGHDDWIDATRKDELRRAEKMAALDGCEPLFTLSSPPEMEGWSWVQVISPEALNREGALMRHCVGSYAEQVAEGSCSIWSLRDAEGKPRITVETSDISFAPAPPPARPFPLSQLRDRLAAQRSGEIEEDPRGAAIERKLAQIRGFANAVIGSKDIGAVESLLEHFQSIGVPVVEAGHDLARAGRALTPAGFGEMKIWRKAEAADDAEAARRAQSLLGGSPGAAELITLASFCERMSYPLAFKSLAPALTEERLGSYFDSADQLAGLLGLRLGAGRLSGRLLDPNNPEDRRACEELAARPAQGDAQSALKEAVAIARLGFDDALEAVASVNESRFDSSFAQMINAQLESERVAIRLGHGPFKTRSVWRPDPALARDARAIAESLPPMDSSVESLRSLAQMANLCAALGYHDAVELLSEKALSLFPENQAKDLSKTAFGLAGYERLKFTGRMPGDFPDHVETRLWTPSELSREPAIQAAAALAKLDRYHERDQIQAMGLFFKLGHSEAAAILSDAILARHGPGPAALIFSRAGVEMPAGVFAPPPGVNPAEYLEQTLVVCMEAGLLSSAKAALAALAALPQSAFDSEESFKTQALSCESQLITIGLIEECVIEAKTHPRVFAALDPKQSVDGIATLQHALGFGALRDRLGVRVGSHVYKGVCALAALLPKEVPQLARPGALTRNVELVGETSKKIASFFSAGPEGWGHEQRDAMIHAITGFGIMNRKAPGTPQEPETAPRGPRR